MPSRTIVACGRCGDVELAGSTTTTFAGFRRFTCDKCAETTVYPRARSTHLAFQLVFVGALGWTLWAGWTYGRDWIHRNIDLPDPSVPAVSAWTLVLPAAIMLALLVAIMLENGVYARLRDGALEE